MIDFQMEAIKVTESVCQSLSVNLDCAQTPRGRGETQNQATYSTQSHRVNSLHLLTLHPSLRRDRGFLE